jgi:hypothetical protein
MAAVQGNTEMVQFLLQMRANIDQQDRAGTHLPFHLINSITAMVSVQVYRWINRITLCSESTTFISSISIINSAC